MKDPLSLNLYSYCVGNPIKLVDIDGHAPGLIRDDTGYASYGSGGGGGAFLLWVLNMAYKLPPDTFEDMLNLAYDIATQDYESTAIDLSIIAVNDGINLRMSKEVGEVKWGMWSDLKKATLNGKEYALVDGRYYTRESIYRMTPKGYRTAAGGYPARGISPSVVDDVLKNGVSRQVTVNNELRTIYELNGIRVVTAQGGKIIITTYPY